MRYEEAGGTLQGEFTPPSRHTRSMANGTGIVDVPAREVLDFAIAAYATADGFTALMTGPSASGQARVAVDWGDLRPSR